MSKAALLDSLLLFTGRHLQELPDYTSSPLPVALEATPEPFRDDAVVQQARDLAAAGNCTVNGNRCHIPFSVDDSRVEEQSRVGVLFYNGALVDPRGYSPLAEILNQRYGLPVVLPIFAADLAFSFGQCDTGRLELAQAEFPEVEKWVLAGHSLGGVSAMVDMWSRWNAMDESAAGLVLLAADVQQTLGCGATDFSSSGLPMAQVLAANDGILNSTRLAFNSAYNSNATFDLNIYGANHGSFGAYNYSERKALLGQVDGPTLIPNQVVWDLTAAAIANVAARTGVPLPTLKAAVSSPDDYDGTVEASDGNNNPQIACPPAEFASRTSETENPFGPTVWEPSESSAPAVLVARSTTALVTLLASVVVSLY